MIHIGIRLVQVEKLLYNHNVYVTHLRNFESKTRRFESNLKPISQGLSKPIQGILGTFGRRHPKGISLGALEDRSIRSRSKDREAQLLANVEDRLKQFSLQRK